MIYDYARVIDILGQKYQVLVSNEKGDVRLIGHDGYCDWTESKIVIDDTIEGENDRMRFGRPDKYVRKVIRHEIIHAFLHRCGLDDYSYDETIVEWMAAMFPELLKTMYQAEAILSARNGDEEEVKNG